MKTGRLGRVVGLAARIATIFFLVGSEDLRRIVIYYIKHIHRIDFGSPVFCEPTLVRLHPALDPHVGILSTRLQVEPVTASARLQQDLNDNVCWQLLSDDISVGLNITVTSRVEVRSHSRSCVLNPSAVTIPMMHLDSDTELAAYYAEPIEKTKLLRDYAKGINAAGDGTTTQFVKNLLWGIKHHFVPATSEQFCQAEASHAFAESARMMNIPARLVRGYKAATADEIESRLHVWPELYLPGTGWCGFDPVEGCAAHESYIAVAKAKTLAETEPIEGRYRGAQRIPETETQIIIRQAAQDDRVDSSTNVPSRNGGRRFPQ